MVEWRDAADPVFNSWDFVSSWINIWRTEVTPYVVLIKDKQGQVCGIAPFYQSTSKLLGFIPIKTLRLLADFGCSSEYLDIIAHSKNAVEIKQTLFEYLHKEHGQWGLIFLRQIAEWKDDSTRVAINAKPALRAKFRHRTFSHVFLPKHGAEFKPSANLRSNLKKAANRLANRPSKLECDAGTTELPERIGRPR